MNGAEELLDLVGKKSSAKEVIIALQEATERLKTLLHHNDDDDVDENGEADDNGIVTLHSQVCRLLGLYSSALPRLAKRKKTPAEVLRPIFSDLEDLIRLSAPNVSQPEGRALIESVSFLVSSLHDWIGKELQERAECMLILLNLMRTTVEQYANAIGAELAQKAFARQFPRLIVPTAPSPKATAADVGFKALVAIEKLGVKKSLLVSHPSVGSLVLLAHSKSFTFDAGSLVSFIPIITTTLQANIGIDETLALLLRSIGALHSSTPRLDLPIDVLVPLVQLLPPIAGSHPDPQSRHVTLRLLSLVLSLAPSPIRLRLLKELLTDEETSSPQMRVAAIGLVKEAVMESLSKPEPDAFTSPLFLHELGSSLLFQKNSNPALGAEMGVVDFLESSEPLRLIECLGLLYVLVQRDVTNRTTIRSRVVLNDINSALLHPLETRLLRWKQETQESDDPDAALQLDILEMWLERNRSAIGSIKTS